MFLLHRFSTNRERVRNIPGNRKHEKSQGKALTSGLEVFHYFGVHFYTVLAVYVFGFWCIGQGL